VDLFFSKMNPEWAAKLKTIDPVQRREISELIGDIPSGNTSLTPGEQNEISELLGEKIKPELAAKIDDFHNKRFQVTDFNRFNSSLQDPASGEKIKPELAAKIADFHRKRFQGADFSHIDDHPHEPESGEKNFKTKVKNLLVAIIDFL